MNSVEMNLHTLRALEGSGYDDHPAPRVRFSRLPHDAKLDYVLEFVAKHKDGAYCLVEALSQLDGDHTIDDLLDKMSRVIDVKQPSREWRL